MAEADYVTTAIRALITGAGAKPSTNPVRVAHVELVAALTGRPTRRSPFTPDGFDLRDRVDHSKKVLTAWSAYLIAILDITQNVPGRLDLRQVDAVLSGLTSDVAGTIQYAAESMAGRAA
jgi:hypothetical protein